MKFSWQVPLKGLSGLVVALGLTWPAYAQDDDLANVVRQTLSSNPRRGRGA